MLYNLMHKNDICGILSLDKSSGDILKFTPKEKELLPYMGSADDSRIRKWWKTRAVPASRKLMMEKIREGGCYTPEEYLVKNLALSMTDAYWICPVEMNLKWEDVNLRNFSGINIITYHGNSSYDPNASLGGEMDKYWDLSGNVPVLYKKCSQYEGQQALNEVFASYVHSLQKNDIKAVEYKAELGKYENLSLCDCITDGNTELIPALEVSDSRKKANNTSDFEHYINVCVEFGIPEDIIRRQMDYQTLFDFVISNDDRHYFNFGVIRDADNLALLSPAPIYDNGNSMFFKDPVIYNRSTILERRIASIYDREEKMLVHVKNKDILNVELLPKPEEVKSFYIDGGISEEKASIISANYTIKSELLKDFQRGHKISVYVEKQKHDHGNGVNSVPEKRILTINDIKTAAEEELHNKTLKSDKTTQDHCSEEH